MPFSEQKINDMLEPFTHEKEAYTMDEARQALFLLYVIIKGQKNKLSEEEFIEWKEEFDNDETVINMRKAAELMKKQMQ